LAIRLLSLGDVEEPRRGREFYTSSGNQLHDLEQQLFSDGEKFLAIACEDETVNPYVEAAFADLHEVYPRNIRIYLRMPEQNDTGLLEHGTQLLSAGFASQTDSGPK